jgi:hypothetical protein
VSQGIYCVEFANRNPFVRMAVIGKIPKEGVMDWNSEMLWIQLVVSLSDWSSLQ